MKVLVLILLFCASLTAQDRAAPVSRSRGPKGADHFDVRRPSTSPHSNSQRRASVAARYSASAFASFRESLPAGVADGLQVEFNDFGFPRRLYRRGGALTDPAAGDLAGAAREYLTKWRSAFGLEELNITGFRTEWRTASHGITVIDLYQSIGGLPVFGGNIRFTFRKSGELLHVSFGTLAAETSALAGSRLTAEQAVLAELLKIDKSITAPLKPPSPGTSGRLSFENPLGRRAIEVKPVVFPTTAASAERAYWLLLDAAPGRAYELVVSAVDGRMLYRHNLQRDAASGRVWRTSPVAGERELLEFPDGWLPADGVTTTGNNTDVYLDWNGDGVPTNSRQEGLDGGRASSPARVFDFPAGEGSTGQDPDDYPAAAIVNAFYFVNLAHDHFYRLGFDEAAGNYQADNLGRGGTAADPVEVHVHDYGVGSNAYFLVTPDGIPGDIHLGIFSMGTPNYSDDRDSAYSGEVILHEYAHGVTSRIVGGPDALDCLQGVQSGGLGEGWSDYFAISFFDDPIVGAYVHGDGMGLRRHGYEGYPLTYKDLGNDGFDAPHDEGEIWAATLWDLRKQAGAELTDRLVMDGLWLTACRPSMIEARDAIMLAAGGENREMLWDVFARHGMGHSSGGQDGNWGEATVFTSATDKPPDLQPGNQAPKVTGAPPVATSIGASYVYQIQAADAESDPLRYELVEGAGGMSVDAATGQVRWTSTFTGARGVVKVSDGHGGAVHHGFYLPVVAELEPGNPVPVEGALRSQGRARFMVPDGAAVAQVSIRFASGDPDLYLLDPEGAIYASMRDGGSETITLPRPLAGEWRVIVDGWRAYKNGMLTLTYPEPASITAGAPLPGLGAPAGTEQLYEVMVPENTGLLRITSSGGLGNVDLLAAPGKAAACPIQYGKPVCDDLPTSAGPNNNELIDIRDPEPGLWYITLVGTTGYNRVDLNVEFFAVGAEPPGIRPGGVVVATQTPLVFGISPNSIISIYGDDFVPESVMALQPAVDGDGNVATRLANTCVEIGGKRAPLFAVLPGQINAQVPDGAGLWLRPVVVIRGCETDNEQRSTESAALMFPYSPGLFNFINNAGGINPLAAVHGGGPDLAGAPGIFPGVTTTPARPGEYISLFGTGFGLTDPPLAAGEIPQHRYPELLGQLPLATPLRLQVGGVEVPPEDIYYAGAAPCCAGLYQFVFKIPTAAGTGDLPVVAWIAGESTVPGPYITVSTADQ